MVGTEERENFDNFASKSPEMAFSKSSLTLLLGPFINSFIMICESMLSASQDGLLQEMLLLKYRIQIFDYIYTILNTSSLEINWFFLVGGQNYSPPYKTLGWGPLPPAITNLFSRAFQQLKSIGSRKCNPLENV
jgi:hypothetical protein